MYGIDNQKKRLTEQICAPSLFLQLTKLLAWTIKIVFMSCLHLKVKSRDNRNSKPRVFCFVHCIFSFDYKIEPVHEISNNEVCATSKASDQPAHTRSLIRTFASRLSIL